MCLNSEEDRDRDEIEDLSAKAKEIGRFKRKVRYSYIIEPILDALISSASVLLDIISIVLYGMKQRWTLMVVSAIPVLLPTLVFTNVYMKDESRGYCKRPSKSRKSRQSQNLTFLHRLEDGLAQAGQGFGISYVAGCCCGCFHYSFHHDRDIRARGRAMVRKSLSSSTKFLFGTLVLRFIAWSWYVKAIIFGVQALKEPEKYMKIVPPDTHWTKELLTRLDFLQAALENAPQCIVQMYMLLTDSTENPAIGLLTLIFSFIDFIRVASSVYWNIQKGPVSAKENLLGSKLWSFANTCSWILLYVARCSALSLIMGSSLTTNTRFLPLLIVILVVHCAVFGRIFSRKEYGQASNKVLVTVFISIFFLPELEATNIRILVQFYWAVTLLENMIFAVPWRGHLGENFSGYCITYTGKMAEPMVNWLRGSGQTGGPWSTETSVQNSTDVEFKFVEESHEGCLIPPALIVFLVPTFTIIGVILRLSVARKISMAIAKSAEGSKGEEDKTMENRVANIYGAKWKRMNTGEMWRLFLKMLRKQTPIIYKDGIENPGSNSDENEVEERIFLVEKAAEDLRSRNDEDLLEDGSPKSSGFNSDDDNNEGQSDNALPQSYFKPAAFRAPSRKSCDILDNLHFVAFPKTTDDDNDGISRL